MNSNGLLSAILVDAIKHILSSAHIPMKTNVVTAHINLSKMQMNLNLVPKTASYQLHCSNCRESRLASNGEYSDLEYSSSIKLPGIRRL